MQYDSQNIVKVESLIYESKLSSGLWAENWKPLLLRMAPFHFSRMQHTHILRVGEESIAPEPFSMIPSDRLCERSLLRAWI